MTFEDWKAAVNRPSCHRDTLRSFFELGWSPERVLQWMDVNAYEVDPEWIPPAKPKRKPGRPSIAFTRGMMQRAMLRGAMATLLPYQLKTIAPGDREWLMATLERMRKALD